MKRAMAVWFIFSGLAASASTDDWKMVSSIVADRTARQIGDLITVTIVEQSSVKKDASDSRAKNVDASFGFDFPGMEAAGVPMWDVLKMPDWTVNGAKSFGSNGSKQSSEELSAAVTVYVTEVLPNGNLIIMGERVVNINGDLLKFTLTGTVREDDINRLNEVLSSRIAGASITYKAVGEFQSSQKKGILSRMTDWILPF
jgi:flagellar L-ring protein FlgH